MKLSKKETKKIILDLIDKSQTKFSTNKLSGGNCGTFVLALAKKLEEQGITDISFGILFKDEEGKAETPKDILQLETDIYHVVLEYGADKFDGTGVTTNAKLLSLAKKQYKDNSPAYVSDIKMKDSDFKQFKSLVENDTNWSIASSKFYSEM